MTIREFIQNKLEEVSDIEITSELPDDLLENDKIYFSYTLTTNYINSDFEHNATNRITIMGFVKMKNDINSDSLSDIDTAQRKICNKLKEMNFKCSYNDVSVGDDIRKIRINAYAIYNEINNGLI